MASVPLLCNICPKHPEFSDISHLLTHVGSKGHLSHYFKAQVRSRQDDTVRRQLETYDRWYAKHQIERLLSQRMVLKESKDIKAKPRGVRKNLVPPVDSLDAPKKSGRAQITSRESSIAAKMEDFIDPQLSQAPYPSEGSPSGNLPLPAQDGHPNNLAFEHRAYVPTMRQRSISSPSRKDSYDTPKTSRTSHSRLPPNLDTESDSDHDELRFWSPAKTSYPDPTALPSLASVKLSDSLSTPNKKNLRNQRIEKISGEATCAFPQGALMQSPKLKGTHYPGMSLFDSASLEAQRKRNQKKNTSIMAQMEANSVEVEPLERIFWPEGTLKKERIITGMVESSPIKEDSPRPKRQRPVFKRVPLDNLSANEPRQVGRRRGRKPAPRMETSNDTDLDDISKRAIAMLDFSSADLATSHFKPGTIEEQDVEWELSMGNPGRGGKHDFIVFDDALDEQPSCSPQPYGHESRVAQYECISSAYSNAENANSKVFSNHNLGFTFASSDQNLPSHATFYNAPSSIRIPAMDWGYRSSINPRSISMTNKENIEPILDCRGRIDNTATHLGSEHSTQRYFSVSTTNPPEFFDFLPPQMEFGGLADSRFSGSSLNPLNANTQRQQNHNFKRQNNHVPSAEPKRRSKPYGSRGTTIRQDYKHL